MASATQTARKPTVAPLVLALSVLGGCASTPPATPLAPATMHPARPAPDKHRAPSHRALAFATDMIGTPYRYGGSSPRGFDCSGLVHYAYARTGIFVPRSTREQYRQIKTVPLKALKPGDLIFFNVSGKKVSHVGIYAGENRFIHAPSSGKLVGYASLGNPYWRSRIVGAGRVAGASVPPLRNQNP